MKSGSYRSAVNLTNSLLTIYGQGKYITRHPVYIITNICINRFWSCWSTCQAFATLDAIVVYAICVARQARSVSTLPARG